MNLIVLLGVQVRAEWVAFVAAISVWAILSRRIMQLFAFTMVVVLLLGVGLLFDIRLPGVSSRGGEISVQGIVGRSVAIVSPSLAARFVDPSVFEAFGGTIQWREDWWHAIWLSINEGGTAMRFFGHGYGYPLASLSNVGTDIRTPHSIFFFALGYGGWCGVAVFFFFQMSLLYALYRAYLITGQPFGIVFWVYQLSVSQFGPYLESPTGAIPFFLIVGICIAPLFEDPETRALKRRMVLEQDMPRAPRQAASAQSGFRPPGVLAGAVPGSAPMATRRTLPPPRTPNVWP
jgi:hypothetical protein